MTRRAHCGIRLDHNFTAEERSRTLQTFETSASNVSNGNQMPSNVSNGNQMSSSVASMSSDWVSDISCKQHVLRHLRCMKIVQRTASAATQSIVCPRNQKRNLTYHEHDFHSMGIAPRLYISFISFHHILQTHGNKEVQKDQDCKPDTRKETGPSFLLVWLVAQQALCTVRTWA